MQNESSFDIEQERKLIAQGCIAESDEDLKHAQTSAAIMASIISDQSDAG